MVMAMMDTDTNDEEVDVCITLVYELAAGSEQMTEDQVHWSITCLDDPNAANPVLQKIWGTFDGFATNAGAYAANTIPSNTMNLDTVNVDGSPKVRDNDAIDGFDANDDDEDTLNPGQVYMISIKTNGDVQEGNGSDSNSNGASDAPGQSQGECNPALNEQHSLTYQRRRWRYNRGNSFLHKHGRRSTGSLR